MTADGERSPVRVVIIDDQHLVRQGIRALLALSSRVVVVGEAGDGLAGLEVIASTTPCLLYTSRCV